MIPHLLFTNVSASLETIWTTLIKFSEIHQGCHPQQAETTLLSLSSPLHFPSYSPPAPSQQTSSLTPSSTLPSEASGTACKHMYSDNCSSSVAPAQKVKKLEWNNNLQPTRHPKACDYVPEVYHLIMLAIHEFLACVCTLDALPDPETQATWANVVWENSWKSVDKEYELTDRVVSLVHF